MKRCTEFCKKRCDGDHHAIFLSLIKVKNKDSLNQFRQLLRAHLIHGFQLEEAVPDARPTFRYPLLHWATVLGKVDVMKMLLKPPFKVSSTLETKTGETALHRLLNVTDSNTKMSKIFEMIDLLSECLTSVDRDRNTPFHVCAELLTSCNKRELDQWKQVFYKMIDTMNDKQKCISLLNQKNGEGEAVLHMLSKRDSLLELVEYLVFYGADLDAQNLNGETPIEISWRFSIPIYNFYDTIKSSNGKGRHKLSDVKTRTALGLCETKDYTEFFNEEDKSSDREESEEEEEEECSFKRKVNKMNQSLINRLAEISDNTDFSLPNQQRNRPRKRRVIVSDSESDEEMCEEPHESSTPVKGDRKSSSGNNIINENPKEGPNRKMTHEQICSEIRKTIHNIKEFYNSNIVGSSEEEDSNDSSCSSSDDDEDDDEIETDEIAASTDVTETNILHNINHLNGRDRKLDRKINILRNAIKKLTSC